MPGSFGQAAYGTKSNHLVQFDKIEIQPVNKRNRYILMFAMTFQDIFGSLYFQNPWQKTLHLQSMVGVRCLEPPRHYF